MLAPASTTDITLPAFPNNKNPSNSDAIGGVFSVDTNFVKEVIITLYHLNEGVTYYPNDKLTAVLKAVKAITGTP